MKSNRLLAIFVIVAANALAQENPGQAGAKNQTPQQPAVTGQTPQQPQLPTTPSTPAPRPRTEPDVDKPESASAPPAGTAPAERKVAEPRTQPALAMQNTDSAQLRQKIEAALKREPALSGTAIVVNVSDDAIDISGNANTNKERLAARRIVQSFAGNRKVKERISVAGMRPPEPEPSQTTPKTTGGPGAAQQPPQTPPDQPDQNLNKPVTDEKKHGDKSDKPR